MTNELSWIEETKTDEVDILPPVIQWRRGDLTNSNPLLKNGCWQFQVEEFSQILSMTHAPADVVHGGGVIVPSYLMDTINIAVLAWKKRWYAMIDGKPVYGPYEEGMKSRFQVWAIVKELQNSLAMVSVSGMNAKYLGDAIFRDLQRKIITPMHRHYKMSFSRYHFWLPLTTAGKRDTAQNQYVTPPVCAQKDFGIESLKLLLTGKEVSELCASYMPEAKRWAETVNEPTQPVQQNGNDNGDDDYEPEHYQPNPGLAEQEIPF